VNLLVLGATGGTGRQLVTQALARGHEVAAFSRHPEKLGITDARLTTVAGDAAADAAAIARALPGRDAVLSALGRGLSFTSHGLMVRSLGNLLPAMERLGLRRLVFLSSYGVGEGNDDARGLSLLFFRTLLRGIYADKATGEAMIQASALDWTLVNPVILTNAAGIAPYRVGEQLDIPSGAKISRASVAEFMLRCIADAATVKKRLLVSP
jgi:uncharacterized protein YbjT (DUF2867 family)